jgi:hypothetical protein
VKRLGPLVVGEPVEGPSWSACYGFVVDTPKPRELLIRLERNIAPTDDWLRDDGDLVEGSIAGWLLQARTAERGAFLLDLVVADLTQDEREMLAFGALSIARLDQWRPPDRQPMLFGDVFVSCDGELTDRVCTPAAVAGRRRWPPGLARLGVAATIAACLVGEDAYPAALDAARKLANGGADATALRSNASALLVELIAVLLHPGSSRGPHLASQIAKRLPSREDVARVVAAHPVETWPPRREPPSLAGLPSLARAAPIAIEDAFALCGPFVVYGDMRDDDGPRRAFPCLGPFRDLVLVPASERHGRDEIALGGLLDPWGRPGRSPRRRRRSSPFAKQLLSH